MSRLSPKPVMTFSIGFTSERFNELPYARRIAKLYRTDHVESMVDGRAFTALPEIARHFGEPYGDSSAVPVWYLAQLARRHVTVALTGDGGDELFGGYEWYRSALTLDRLARSIPAPARPLLRAGQGWLRGRTGRLLLRLGMSPGERFANLRQTMDLPDRMTMAHSLEARSPFLDHELVELAASIPPALTVDATGGKVTLKRAVRDLLPPSVLQRPKMGFSVPLEEWLSGKLRSYASQVMAESSVIREWLRPRTVQGLLDEHAAGRRDLAPSIWNLLMLAEWSKIYAR
jgi:asparagine synthase (glutamine-hydrolysing)